MDYYIKQVRELNANKNLTAKINTFGCQMNAHDSEKLLDMLLRMGYKIYDSDTDKHLDLVLFNTCCVRENPEDKLFGNLGYFKNQKKINPNLKIILCGCMMQQKNIIQKIKQSYNFVDVVFGTFNFHKLPDLLFNNLTTGSQIIDIWDENKKFEENFCLTRKYFFKASVNIIYGCNNFCSYCIVPFVRGRERSRNYHEILKEVKRLADDGVKEVMLLGQNVNSYGLDLVSSDKISFAELLHKINNVNGIERVRFMTSHPKDLSDDLIFAIRDLDKVCKHLHLPVQSGSNRILKLMNRKYTREKYLELIKKLKGNIPDIALSTDIIVGFPDETEQDFLETIDLIKKVEFNNAFSFIYSKRAGTRAAEMSNQIPKDAIRERFDYLIKTLNTIIEYKNKSYVGSVEQVLVEEFDSFSNKLTGRNDKNILVHFEGTENMIGKLINVKIKEAKPFYLIGKKLETEVCIK